MQEVLKKLEQAQEVDIQIGIILKKKAEYPLRLKVCQDEAETVHVKVNEKNKIIEELEKGRRQQYGALELNEDRISRSQKKSDQVKTNEEYQAILKEVESLQKNSTIIKENAKKVDDELLKHKDEINLLENTLKQIQLKTDEQMAQIKAEETVLDQELSVLQGTRLSIIKDIDTRYLSLYDRIRIAKFGIGIVPVVGGNCKGCHMRIPPQAYIEIQKAREIHVCPSCKRILFFKEPPKTEKELAASASTH